jgi:hypothetical protein
MLRPYLVGLSKCISISNSQTGNRRFRSIDNDIKLFSLLLSPSNPIFSVDINKNLTVDDLRVEIKKKMGVAFPHYELCLWQVSEHSCCEVMRLRENEPTHSIH